jgi:3-dehydroquinate synthetase
MKSNLTYLKKLELFKELDNFKDGQFFAVADQKVKNHLPQWVSFSPHIFWLKNPEEEKTLDVYRDAIDFFLKQGITRDSTLYAIGGGATTDLAGFVAATILRGINWVSIPTTLLGMIDGSIGGKVGVNMPQGKNLVGAFHLPQNVYICGDFLTSLPEKEWMSGKGEVLKYGFLSKEINGLILKKAPIEDIALACAKYKNEIVDKDFKESGERIFLNLGHTLGHAFESTLKIPHGQAVAMGLKYLFKVMKNDEALEQWEQMVKALNLPMEKMEISGFHQFNKQSFLSYLDHDKKNIKTSLRLVLVKGIGFCYVEYVPLKEFKAKIQAHADFQH